MVSHIQLSRYYDYLTDLISLIYTISIINVIDGCNINEFTDLSEVFDLIKLILL